ERIYEDRYGKGSAFNREDIQMIDFRVRASGDLQSPQLNSHDLSGQDPEAGLLERKEMYFEQTGKTTAGYYDFEKLDAGVTIDGPGVMLTPVTSIVINPGDRARIDQYRNVRIDIGGAQ
ncbi:MAG: N-methylhydantoinase A, partial [Natronomonas sp.]